MSPLGMKDLVIMTSKFDIEQERMWIRRKLLGILVEAIEKGDKEKEKALMDLMSITQIKGAMRNEK